MQKSVFSYFVSALYLCILFAARAEAQPDLSKLKLPPGFKASLYADGVPGARQMALSPEGTLYIGTIVPNKVYALPDRNRDGKPDSIITLAENLNRPNGVAFHNGALYVAEIGRITRYDGIEKNLENIASLKPVVVNAELPTREWHGYKYIRFGPDGLLYAPVGAPCNVCVIEDEPRFATLMRMNADGRNAHVFASGIRNTVGFDWHPKTKELWFTDNGRDYLGNNLPPDELNCAPRKGLHFGFPYRYGMNVPDPEFGYLKPDDGKSQQFEAPRVPLGPHVASLGMRFYTGSQFPAEYQGNIFICEHGSWNRSKKIGYRISRVTFDNKTGTPLKYQPFVEGFRQDESFWGRPVDLLQMPDGSILISDDYAGCVYRIHYDKNSK